MLDTIKFGCVVIVGLILTALAIAAFAIFFGLLQLPLMNINRQVTQQSIQYVQAHQQILMSYWSNYQTGDAIQQAANTTLICQQAPLLDASQWPAQITAFVSEHCR